jgi:hypothetical protein
MKLVRRKDEDELRSLLRDDAFSSHVSKYWAAVGGGLASGHRGAKVDPAGVDLLTRSPATGLRIGIHLDDWHQFPAQDRGSSPLRLALNLGPGQRWLLLIDTNHFWMQIAARDPLARAGTPQLREWAGRLETGVYRYGLDPGFAYLAGTEYYGHDGSTRWSTEPSVTLQWSKVGPEWLPPNDGKENNFE